MPYHVYTKTAPARSLAKTAQFAEDGHPEVVFKDLLGNILTYSAVNALAEARTGAPE